MIWDSISIKRIIKHTFNKVIWSPWEILVKAGRPLANSTISWTVRIVISVICLKGASQSSSISAFEAYEKNAV